MACLVLIAGCLTLAGCAHTGKKANDGKTPSATPGNEPAPAKFPTSSDPLLNGGTVSQAKGSAVLAGRVIDHSSRAPANTSIRLVSMDAKETSSPTEVSATAEGYFTIQGLKPGASYKLLARGKNGERLLAGITYTTAPNLAVVIQVKEDFANSTTPDVFGSPAFQDKGAKPAETSTNFPASNNALPTMGLSGPGNEFEMPAVAVPAPARPTSSAPASQNWVPGPKIAADKGTFWPPPLDIPNPAPRPAPPPLQIPQSPPAMSLPAPVDSRLDGPARVPSCVLVGKQVVNFALPDVNGEPWEFKSKRRGKLVLIDFWSTTCVPCKEAVPALRQLQSKYAGQGLEVVGVAIESGGGPQEQAYRVNALAQRLQINYRQLLSSNSVCPVRSQFRIEAVPTMVLVDQNGMIVWRHQGKLDRAMIDEVERLIQRKLG